MKVVREGKKESEFWRGIWQCVGCGRQIEFEPEDAAAIKLPDGTEDHPDVWKYVGGTWVTRPRFYGPCPSCAERKEFTLATEKGMETDGV